MISAKPKPSAVAPNLEAEFGVLSIILSDNASYHMIADRLQPAHFGEPFHAAVFEAVGTLIQQGLQASPVTVRARVETHPSYTDAGGADYLDRVAKLSLPTDAISGYATAIVENYARRNLLALSESLSVQALASSTSLADIASKAGATIGTITEGLAGGSHRRTRFSFGEALTDAVDRAALAYQHDGVPPDFVPSGIKALDRIVGGFSRGDLVIVAARPGIGKTALATVMAYENAKQGRPALYVSEEMAAWAVALRLISTAMTPPKVPYSRIRTGRVSEREFETIVDTVQQIQSLPLPIVDREKISLIGLESEIVRAKQVHPTLGLVVVDYLQIMETVDNGRQNRTEQLGALTGGLKQLARRHEVTIVALSQLNRAIEARENKRPTLADIRESGSIEQDADIIVFPFREEYYLSRTEPAPNTKEHLEWQDKLNKAAGIMELIVGKNRQGETGTARATANMATNSVFSADDNQPEMFS